MSVSDDLMWRYIELLSFKSGETIQAQKQAVTNGGNPRDVKFEFAQEIVERFHSKAAAGNAAREFVARFRQHEMPDDVPEVKLAAEGDGLSIAAVLKQAGLTASTSDALRMLAQGGVKMDGEKISDKSLKLARGASVVLQVGKRKFARVTVN